jgi:hypothetical protein
VLHTVVAGQASQRPDVVLAAAHAGPRSSARIPRAGMSAHSGRLLSS